jgi:hypothetical protein
LTGLVLIDEEVRMEGTGGIVQSCVVGRALAEGEVWASLTRWPERRRGRESAFLSSVCSFILFDGLLSLGSLINSAQIDGILWWCFFWGFFGSSIIVGTMAPAAANTPYYEKGEKVLCFHHELLYEAKVLDYQLKDTGDRKGVYEYKVHYKGWKAT